jgi:hypothetical protein
MIENTIVSVPITIKLIDTSHLYQSQHEYPQIMIEPSPCHYPQFIDSPTKQTLYTTLSDTEQPSSRPCFLFDIFCCCK